MFSFSFVTFTSDMFEIRPPEQGHPGLLLKYPI